MLYAGNPLPVGGVTLEARGLSAHSAIVRHTKDGACKTLTSVIGVRNIEGKFTLTVKAAIRSLLGYAAVRS